MRPFLPRLAAREKRRGIHDAVLAVKDPSYGPRAVIAISAPVTIDDTPSSEGTRKVNDELEFWQTTAIQTIRALKFKGAAKPLVTVMMTKNKLALAALAQQALLEMPAEGVPLLTAALNGTDPELKKLEAEWGADKGYVPIMLNVLSYTSLPAARDAIYAAIPGLDNDTNKAAAAQSLIWFPVDPKLTETFKGLYGKLPPIAAKGDNDTGAERAQLLVVASELYEPRLLPWALTESATAKGDNMLTAKVGAIQSATRLMQPDQKKLVSSALSNLENSGLSPNEKRAVADNVRAAFGFASQALDQCNRDVRCYVRILDEPIPVQPNANWKAIKAAAMCAILGNEQTRKDLVAKIERVKNPGARLATAVAINHLTPAGDITTADALDKVVQGDTDRKDEARRGDDALTKVALMLRTRASR